MRIPSGSGGERSSDVCTESFNHRWTAHVQCREVAERVKLLVISTHACSKNSLLQCRTIRTAMLISLTLFVLASSTPMAKVR